MYIHVHVYTCTCVHVHVYYQSNIHNSPHTVYEHNMYTVYYICMSRWSCSWMWLSWRRRLQFWRGSSPTLCLTPSTQAVAPPWSPSSSLTPPSPSYCSGAELWETSIECRFVLFQYSLCHKLFEAHKFVDWQPWTLNFHGNHFTDQLTVPLANIMYRTYVL